MVKVKRRSRKLRLNHRKLVESEAITSLGSRILEITDP